MSRASHFLDMKRRGEKIVVLTAYDAPTARIEVEAGVDIILVGDSVGTNVLGYGHEREVTLADMAHHVAAVRRGAPSAYIIGDFPYATYVTPVQALESARVLRAAGADCMKFEGARPDVARALVTHGFEVCGHIGLESQHQAEKRRQGRTAEAARKLLNDALALDAVGQSFLVLELVPQELAARITKSVQAVTIGIGAGPDTDGQVLVVNDLVGLNARAFKHNRRYAQLADQLRDAVGAYVREVRARRFPGPENAFNMPEGERAAFDRE